MAVSIVAPCGLICDLCAGFQRKKNRCPGCLKAGSPLAHCQTLLDSELSGKAWRSRNAVRRLPQIPVQAPEKP